MENTTNLSKSTRVNTRIFGAYAALLGAAHGFFELQQGTAVITRPLIMAIGGSCDPQISWHGCFPAMSIFPTYRMTGMIVLGVTVLLLLLSLLPGWWTKGRGILTLGLALAVFLSGGGFVPMLIGVAAGVNALLSAGKPGKQGKMGAWWPWLMGVYFGLILVENLTGTFFNDLMKSVVGVSFMLENVLLVMITISAAKRQNPD